MDHNGDEVDVAESSSERVAGLRVSRFLEEYAVVLVWIGIIILFSVLRPGTFFTFLNFRIIFGSQAVLIILTLGLLIVLVVGEFDLAFAAILGFSSQLLAILNARLGWPLATAIMVTLIAAALVGVLHAVLIVRLGVPSVVVTLGTLTLLPGLGQLLTRNEIISGVSKSLVRMTNSRVLFGLPLVFYYGLLACFLMWYVLQHTPLGRHLYFVGQGRDIARLAGVNVDRLRSGALMANALISCCAGILLTGQLASASPETALSFLLPAFAAAFLGATTILPGRFNVWGSFVAVYFLVTGFSGLQLLGLSSWVQPVFFGTSLIIAVVFARIVSLGRSTGS